MKEKSSDDCSQCLTHPLYIAVQAEDVEDFVSVDFRRLKAIYHKNWRVSMRTVLRRWWSVPRSIALATTTTSTHSWPHAVGRRGTVTLVIVAMITSLRATLIRKKKQSKKKQMNRCITVM